MGDVALDVDRAQVLAYRVAAHQLDRPAIGLQELAVFDLGVQDTAFGTARLALAARSEDQPGSGRWRRSGPIAAPRICIAGRISRRSPPRSGR